MACEQLINSKGKCWCKHCYSLYRKEWYRLNLNYNKNYYNCNKEKIKQLTKTRRSQRQKEDPSFKLGIVLRKRLLRAIKTNAKAGSAVRDLGCSIEELKLYLESKFQPGMTWENWGYRGWHMDHIEPLCSFDLTNLDEFKIACHYTNLQPLWAQDHYIKSSADRSRGVLSGT